MLLSAATLQLVDARLDSICEQIPAAAASPKGERPRVNQHQMHRSIFWIPDNVARWKDLLAEVGPKSTVHDWSQRRLHAGVFEQFVRQAGRCVEQHGGFKLYQRFVTAIFSKAWQESDRIGVFRIGKGVKIMLLGAAKGLPVTAFSTEADSHESRLVRGLFGSIVTCERHTCIVGDKAYESKAFDATLAAPDIEIIAPHWSNR